ncbi:MAG TPA: ABC transporter permease [Thermomicrobiales bacterium]|jgi:peptide/nickel transport system permease protein
MSASSSATAITPPPLAAASEAMPERAARRHRRWLNPTLLSGSIFLGVIVLFVVGYPFLVDWSPTEPDFAQPTFAGPSWQHPLGTDNFGRDNLTRIAYGGRVDLVVALIATAVTVIVGGVLGLVAGYVGGWFDTFTMRLVDFMLTIPYLVLVIAIVAVLGTGVTKVIYAIWLIGWVTYARIVRAETMVARRLEYVEAARVIGMHHARIMLRHIAPNVVAVALIYSMADIVLNILTAASLSFLGLGVQPPKPEWGLMVAEARDFFLRDWRLMTYPGLAMVIVGAAFCLIGEGLAQALRPKG